MKKITAMLLAAVLLVGSSGCGSGTAERKPSQSAWVTYKEVYDRVQNEKNEDILVYSYQQPMLSSDSAGANIINTKLDNATTAFVYGSGGIQEMTDLAKMDWKETWFTCYALTREVSVARLDDAVASFRYSDYAFTGGVHGYTAEHGMSYDMVSGEQLSLASLTHDEWALREVCRQYLIEVLEDENLVYKNGLFPDYKNYLDVMLKNWVFTESGLQFIAQPYVMAAYAVGTIRITVPYARIAHVLDEKWMPAQRTYENTTVTVDVADGPQTGLTDFVISEMGMPLVVTVNGTIYDFSVEGVNSYPSGGETVFYMTQQHLFSPEITSESFGVRVNVPDTKPETMLRWRDHDGTEYQYFLTYDGKNGGVLLEAVKPKLERE